MEVLAQEPLLPVAKTQRGMMGIARSQEARAAQLTARGLTVPPSNFTTQTPFHFLRPRSLWHTLGASRRLGSSRNA